MRPLPAHLSNAKALGVDIFAIPTFGFGIPASLDINIFIPPLFKLAFLYVFFSTIIHILVLLLLCSELIERKFNPPIDARRCQITSYILANIPSFT